MKNKKTKSATKRSNGKREKVEAPKAQPRIFKTKIVDPTETIKVRIDHKTVLEIKKGRDIEQVVANYHANHQKSLNSLLKG